MIHSALRIGKVARAQRQRRQQQEARRRHHHHHKQPQVKPELGPYDIWEVGEDCEWSAPPRWVTRFSSAEERDAYLTEKRARRQAECERIAAYWRRIDEENERRDAYEAQKKKAQEESYARIGHALLTMSVIIITLILYKSNDCMNCPCCKT